MPKSMRESKSTSLSVFLIFQVHQITIVVGILFLGQQKGWILIKLYAKFVRFVKL